MNCDRVLHSTELLLEISSYCSAEEIARASATCSTIRRAFNNDQIWEKLCNVYGFKSLISATKTRGKRTFKSIYISALCIECKSTGGGKGSVVIDTNGGSHTRMGGVDGPTYSLIILCSGCFHSVQDKEKWNDRVRFALPNAKKRLNNHIWTTLLNKIPYKQQTNNKSKEKRKGKKTLPLSDVVSGDVSGSGGGGHVATAVGAVNRRKLKLTQKERYENPENNNHLLKLLS